MLSGSFLRKIILLISFVATATVAPFNVSSSATSPNPLEGATAIATANRKVVESPATAPKKLPSTAAPPAPTAAPFIDITLHDALERHWLKTQYYGNGREDLAATITNLFHKPIRVLFPSGIIFHSEKDSKTQIVIAREGSIEIPENGTRAAHFLTAALSLKNTLGVQPFKIAVDETIIPAPLEHLLTQIQVSPEVSQSAIQTAVLIALENPPLAAFAKFNLISKLNSNLENDYPSAFQVPVADIMDALNLLKDAGIKKADCATAQEPQLQVEAMIDPLGHARALRYYEIAPQKEWGYWRDELLKGDASTRHYALYGIGRYYPDVALQMLPTWARDRELSAVFRQSAIQALAETRAQAAISVLQQLQSELGADTKLGESARQAALYLENHRQGSMDISADAGLSFRLSQPDLR